MIETITSVAKTLFTLGDAFKKTKREKRDRLADLFFKISNCIADTSTELKKDRVPHGKCAEMLAYADALEDTIKDEVGPAKAKELAEDLRDAHEVEALLSQIHDKPDREEQLAKLDQAAGIFLALSNITRAI